jgi:hypothetical protein
MLQMKHAVGRADTKPATAAPTICPVVDETQHRPQHMTAANLEISMKLRTILVSTAFAALGASAWAQGTTTDMTAKPAAPAVSGAATLKAPAAAMPATATTKPAKTVAMKKVHKKKMHKVAHKPAAKDAMKAPAQ